MNPDTEHELLLCRLSDQERAEAMDDDDFAQDLIDKEAQSVVSYGWDSQISGGSGASWLSHWRGLYFVASSDYPQQGPFESIEGAFGSEAFQALSGGLEFTYSSRRLKRSQLLDLVAQSFIGEEGDTIEVNGAAYVYRNRRFLRRKCPGLAI